MDKLLFIYPLFFIYAFYPHTKELPLWVTTTVFVLVVLYFISIFFKLKIFKPLLIHTSAVASIFFVFMEFRTLLGPESATSLLVLLVSLKLHELNSKRDYIIFLILNLLVIMYWLLFSQTMLSTLYMFLGLIGTGLCLIITHAPHLSPREVFKGGLRISLLDLVIVIPLFFGFFFLFPRFQTPFAHLLSTERSEIGFSDEIRPGDLADLIRSQEHVFRVYFDDGRTPPIRNLYWRGLVLNETDGFNWRVGQENEPPSETLAEAPLASSQVRNRVDYTLVLEPRYNKKLFPLERVIEFSLTERGVQNEVIEKYGQIYETKHSLVQRLRFDGASYVENLSISENPQLSSIEKNKYLELSFSPSQRLKGLLSGLKNPLKSTDPMALSNSVLNYFKEESFTYSLTTPDYPNLDAFLFGQKIGFCEHYASAYSILMRALGVPSRIVIGFQGGEFNDFGNYFLVRDQHAHAWSEIWIDGQGWLRVDPTSVINATRIETGMALAGTDLDRSSSGLYRSWRRGMLYIDSLNARYTMFLLNFGLDDQIQIFKNFGIENINKWKMFFYSLIFFILILGITLSRNRWTSFKRRNDPLDESYRLIIKKLDPKKEFVRSCDGPIETYKKIAELSNNEAIENLIFTYSRLKYGPEPSPNEIQKFNDQVKSTIKSL